MAAKRVGKKKKQKKGELPPGMAEIVVKPKSPFPMLIRFSAGGGVQKVVFSAEDLPIGEPIKIMLTDYKSADDNLLKWEEDSDEDGNSVWSADSPYNDDGRSLRWRLRQKLYNDKIVWYEDHDDELGNAHFEYNTLREAKEAVQEEHEATLEKGID